MRKTFILLFGILTAFTAVCQVPAINDIVRTNTLSPTRVANALDAGTAFTAAGTDTYTVAVGLGVYSGSATYEEGDKFTILFTNANTGTSPTININSEGAKDIVDNKGSPVAVGDVEGILNLWYDGTDFRIIGGTGGGGGTVTSVTGTTNRITSSGGVTPAIDISASYVGQSSLTTTGTLTSGATGTGFTLSFTNSTLSGRIAAANIPAAYIIDQATASTAGGTITLDCNSQIQRSFLGSATFATAKAIALSNTTNAMFFNFIFEVTNVAAELTPPSDWLMASSDFDGTDWVPPGTGKYEIGGSFDDTANVWYVKIAGPFN